MNIIIKNNTITKKFNDIKIGECFIDTYDDVNYDNPPRIYMSMSAGDFNSVCLNDGAVTNFKIDKELSIVTVNMEITL